MFRSNSLKRTTSSRATRTSGAMATTGSAGAKTIPRSWKRAPGSSGGKTSGRGGSNRQPLTEPNESASASVSTAMPTWAKTPHITLRTGVIVPETALSDFIIEFGRLLNGERAFPVCTEGIFCGTYEQDNGPRPIVCYRIRKERPLLALNKKLLSYHKFRQSDRTCFEPHLTIAYEDLTFEGFATIQHHLATRNERESLIRYFLHR